MRVAMANFKGQVPKLHPRLLPEGFAQTARNTRLNDGTIAPINQTRLEATLAASAVTIAKAGSTWLSWNSVVDVAPGPVAEDRLYFTGDGAPKMRVGSTVYPLKLAAPALAPTVSRLSTPGSTVETVLYCYTFVTGFGEESQPSPLSSELQVDSTVTVRLTGFSAAPTGRNVIARRIYRSQTSATGITDLYFVAELSLATTTYDHNITTAPLQEPLPTQDFDAPIDALTGLTSLPNGMMAAFYGKELFFAEPFQPHAWPAKYALKTDATIVGLAAFGSNLIVLTTASPYVVQGTHPDNMVMERVDRNMPCLSKRGIVDLGYAALFPTNDGLAMISASDANVITRNLFTREQWRALAPDTFVAKAYDGRYVFTFVSERAETYSGGTPSTVGADAFGGGTPSPLGPTALLFDFGTFNSAFGAQRVGLIDVSGESPFFVASDVDAPEAMCAEPETGALYMLVDGTKVVEWDSQDSPPAMQVWRSRLIQTAAPVSFGAFIAEADSSASGENIFKARVFADGLIQREITRTNQIERLPGNSTSSRWEVEIESNFPITAIRMATTVEELIE